MNERLCESLMYSYSEVWHTICSDHIVTAMVHKISTDNKMSPNLVTFYVGDRLVTAEGDILVTAEGKQNVTFRSDQNGHLHKMSLGEVTFYCHCKTYNVVCQTVQLCRYYHGYPDICVYT